MATKTVLSAYIDANIDLLFSGYVREAEKLLLNEQAITRALILIMIQYGRIVKFHRIYDDKIDDKAVKFIDDTTVETFKSHEMVLFGYPISASEWSGFVIEYIIRSGQRNRREEFNPNFMFISDDSASDIVNALEANKKWQTDVCTIKKWKECGVVMYSGFDHFRLFESPEKWVQIGPEKLSFKYKDRIKFRHTFKTSKCELLYNDKSMGCFKLEGKSVQPYVTQYYINVIEVTEYKLFW